MVTMKLDLRLCSSRTTQWIAKSALMVKSMDYVNTICTVFSDYFISFLETYTTEGNYPYLLVVEA